MSQSEIVPFFAIFRSFLIKNVQKSAKFPIPRANWDIFRDKFYWSKTKMMPKIYAHILRLYELTNWAAQICSILAFCAYIGMNSFKMFHCKTMLKCLIYLCTLNGSLFLSHTHVNIFLILFLSLVSFKNNTKS